MTDGATIQCRRCGFTNSRGDQFCGSCGAFLEWQDESAATAPAAGPGPPDAAAPDAATPDGPAAAGPPPAPATGSPPAPPSEPAAVAPAAGAPIAQPTPPAGGSAAPPEGGFATPPEGGSEPDRDTDLVRCPACGIANPATRTFCQSCGTTLEAASPVAESSPEMIAAAIASTPATTTPIPTTGARPARHDRPAGRGIPRWVVVVALAGVLVGVGIVIVGPMVAGPGPGSAATSGPTGGPPAGSPGAASGGVPAASGATPASGGAAVKLTLTGATASSVLGDRARYQATKAIDGDLATAWQEGSKTEQGQWIQVTFDPARADTLVVRNGYQASTALYKGNLRLKDIEVSVDGGSPIAFHLKDTTKAQRIDLGQVSGATSVRITIESTYPSTRTSVAGTPFDDAALSEISVLGVPGG